MIRMLITAGILAIAIAVTPKLPSKQTEIFAPVHFISVKETGLSAFLRKLAQLESSNNPVATNRYGMLGKYQFHPATIRSVGLSVTRKQFLNNEELQDTAMIRYLKSNKEELLPYIRKYAGTRYRGVDITESGILAGAHFAGSTGVINFFKYGRNRRDGNGFQLTKYMKTFNGFDLKI